MLQAGLNKKLLDVSVTLMDGTMHTMAVDAATTSRELCQQLSEFIGLRDMFGFSIYIAMYTKVGLYYKGLPHKAAGALVVGLGQKWVKRKSISL